MKQIKGKRLLVQDIGIPEKSRVQEIAIALCCLFDFCVVLVCFVLLFSFQSIFDRFVSGYARVCVVQLATPLFRDRSKSIGWGGPEHLEMWWIKNRWPTPSFWHKTE